MEDIARHWINQFEFELYWFEIEHVFHEIEHVFHEIEHVFLEIEQRVLIFYDVIWNWTEAGMNLNCTIGISNQVNK